MFRRPVRISGRRPHTGVQPTAPSAGRVDAPAASETASAFAASIARHEQLVGELQAALEAQRRVLAQLNGRLELLTGSRRDADAREGFASTINDQDKAEQRRYDVVARLLGPFEVSIGGVPVGSWRSQKAASLLKYLLLHDHRPARRETLMEVFWPSSSPKSARNNLNVTVYQLRGTLREIDPGRTHIVYTDGTYRLDPHLTSWCDVAEFSRALQLGHRSAEAGDGAAALTAYRHARELYGGMLLEGDTSGEWFFDAQRHLHQEQCGLLERLGTILLDHGDLTESVVMGEELLIQDPCRETGHQLLMRAYAALQQPQLVVKQYQRCADLLRRELSVDPAPATVALYGRLVPAR